MKSLRRGFRGEAPNVPPIAKRSGKKQSGSKASPDGRGSSSPADPPKPPFRPLYPPKPAANPLPPKRHQALYNMKKQGAQPFELRAPFVLFASVLPNDSALNENRSMQLQPVRQRFAP